MKNLIFIFTPIFFIACGSNSTREETENTKSFIQPKQYIDTVGIKWIPKSYNANFSMLHTMLTKNLGNAKVTIDGFKHIGTHYTDDDAKIEIIIFENLNDGAHNACLGLSSYDQNAVYLNKDKIHKDYIEIKNILAISDLKKEIVAEEYFFEAILFQEIWHLLNKDKGTIRSKIENEYLSEIPSLDSRAGNFYLIFRYIRILSEAKSIDYSLMRKKYINAFELRDGDDEIYMDSLVSLVQRYGFHGIKNRYKEPSYP